MPQFSRKFSFPSFLGKFYSPVFWESFSYSPVFWEIFTYSPVLPGKALLSKNCIVQFAGIVIPQFTGMSIPEFTGMCIPQFTGIQSFAASIVEPTI